jgi:hypothetical protein
VNTNARFARFATHSLSEDVKPPFQPQASDRRFDDPAWKHLPYVLWQQDDEHDLQPGPTEGFELGSTAMARSSCWMALASEPSRDFRTARDLSVRQWTMSRLKVRVRAIQESRFPADPRPFLT